MATRGPPQIFDTARRATREARAARLARSDAASQVLLSAMVEDVVERLDFMRREGGSALVHGDRTGRLAPQLRERGFTVGQAALGELDEELPPDRQHDLIVSLGTLDTVNDLPGALIHLRNGLAEKGLFIGCFPGAGSVPVLRQALLAADAERPAARIHPQVDNQAASALMARAGFARQVVDSHTLKVRYGSFDRLVADLRAQGLTNVLADPPPSLTREGLKRARAAFVAQADEDGRVTEMFEILTLTGWR